MHCLWTRLCMVLHVKGPVEYPATSTSNKPKECWVGRPTAFWVSVTQVDPDFATFPNCDSNQRLPSDSTATRRRLTYSTQQMWFQSPFPYVWNTMSRLKCIHFKVQEFVMSGEPLSPSHARMPMLRRKLPVHSLDGRLEVLAQADLIGIHLVRGLFSSGTSMEWVGLSAVGVRFFEVFMIAVARNR